MDLEEELRAIEQGILRVGVNTLVILVGVVREVKSEVSGEDC